MGFPARKDEKIGGGFFVFRRGKKTGRIGIKTHFPFEHPSLEAAVAEAARLRAKMPGETFIVVRQVFETIVVEGATDET